MKRCSTALVTKKMQIKTKLRLLHIHENDKNEKNTHKKQIVTSVDKDVEKTEYSFIEC